MFSLQPQRTLNCKGSLVSLERPVVMGILNVTPDSFYDGGRHATIDAALRHCEQMLAQGATFIDVGGMSSRPGAPIIEEHEEKSRVLPVIEALTQRFPEALLSVDTIRSSVAKACVEAGACLVNDISAGRFDESLIETVARLGVPYVLMHMKGTPADMQQQAHYEDVVREVLDFFIREVNRLHEAGVKDIILDPGFGFGKTVEHNYSLLKHLQTFMMLEKPLLVGISRKSMICRVLEVPPHKALNGSTALHMAALLNGASILRVHDVAEAMEVIRLWEAYAKAP